AVGAGSVFRSRHVDGFSSESGGARGAQRVRRKFDAANMVGTRAGRFTRQPGRLWRDEMPLLLLSRRGTDARAVASGSSLTRASRMGARGGRSVGAGNGRVLLDSSRTCFVGRAALFFRGVGYTSEDNCGRRAMSREGNVGAFFDLDGTLLSAPSVERRFIFFLLMRGLIGLAQFARCGARFIANITRNRHAAIGANKAYFSGVSTRCVDEWSRQSASHRAKFFSDGLDRLRFHFVQGHRVFLITGAPTPLAELVGIHFS